MALLEQALLLTAILGSGVVAGLCFTFGSFVMHALDDLGPPAAIRAMQSINARILKSLAMPLWLGTVPVGIGAALLSGGSPFAILGAALYTAGALLVTGLGNVPLNESLDTVHAESAEADARWREYLVRWGRLNTLRTILFMLATLGFGLAL